MNHIDSFFVDCVYYPCSALHGVPIRDYLTKRTVCPDTPFKPLVLKAYRRNIDFSCMENQPVLVITETELKKERNNHADRDPRVRKRTACGGFF